jgi:hypothetical protein
VIHISSRVRLITPDAQPEIGTAIGTVHGMGDGWVEVAWPNFRSHHKIGDVELSTTPLTPEDPI